MCMSTFAQIGSSFLITWQEIVCVSNDLMMGRQCDSYSDACLVSPLNQALCLHVHIQYSKNLGNGFVIF